MVTTSELLDLCERLDAFADDPKLVTIGIVASAIHRATAALRESMRERDEAMNELERLNHWQENFLCETQQKLDKAREQIEAAWIDGYNAPDSDETLAADARKYADRVLGGSRVDERAIGS